MYPSTYGDYVLLERLGVGGMSQVDLARKAVDDAAFVRFLVIKRIKADRTDDAAFVRMFKDEARITAELHHNNIAQVYDFGRQGDEYYMALEFIPGVDVRRVINVLRERRQRVPIRVALRILSDVLSALEYAHGMVDRSGRPMEIVHRDVNPRNIMVSTRGEVKLIDFGVAKATDRLERTKTDHVKGKFAYMAPEQVTTQQIDHRADLFAVGLTLHELITGYGAFQGMTQVQIMHRLISGRMPVMTKVPSEIPDADFLKKVHKRSLEADPELRYGSAAEFRRDLENVAAPLGGLATQEEMVRFLKYVDPEMVEKTAEKLEKFAKPIDLSATAPAPAIGDASGTLPGLDTVAQTQSGTSVATTGALAGTFLLGGMVTTGLAVLLLGGLGLYFFMGPQGTPNKTGGTTTKTEKVDFPTPNAGSSTAGPGGKLQLGVVGSDGEEASPEKGSETSGTSARSGSSAGTSTARDVPSSNQTRTESGDASQEAAGSTTDAPPEGEGDAPGETESPDAVEGAAEEPPPPVEPEVKEATPPPEPPPPAASGTLQVTSAVRGRAIKIDGRDLSKSTPARLEVGIGTRTVEVEGYASQTVNVVENKVTMVAFK